MEKVKAFMNYEQQIALLKKKKLTIVDEQKAIECLKSCSYFSLISGYKDIFKLERNGNYRPDATFENIALLYNFDNVLRQTFLLKLIRIERHIKSLYSFSFCQLYGETQADYLNVNNYNYIPKYQDLINEYISIVRGIFKHSDKYPYVNYNVSKYGTVPLWVLIHTLTFGNISKLYSFSTEKLQSKIAREFNGIYSDQLVGILNVLTKYRNVCAHGERLYNYRTQKAFSDLPPHKFIKGNYDLSKNDLFNVCIAFKTLLPQDEFTEFTDLLETLFDVYFEKYNDYYKGEILKGMGFQSNWKELLLKNR